jgi:hypothetical protein
MKKNDLEKLGEELKSYYGTLRSSPLPDQLTMLAQQLDEKFLESRPDEAVAGPAAAPANVDEA